MEQQEQTKGFKQCAENESVDFTVYAEIYGRDKMISKVFADFTGDVEKLTARELKRIADFLELKSGINQSEITHTVLRIDYDNDLDEEIEREESENEDDEEDGTEKENDN